MEFTDVVEHRFSVRKYKNKPVDEEKINRILKVIQKCPSAGNLQAFQVFLVQDEHTRLKLAAAAGGQDFIAEAPIALVFCAVPEKSSIKYGVRGETLYSIQDATIACTFGMLAAVDNGLGSVWVGAFDVESVQNVIGCHKNTLPIAILPVGFSAEAPGKSSRRDIEEMVRFIG